LDWEYLLRMIVLADLEQICRYAKRSTLSPWVEPLNAAMQEFEVNNGPREAAFLAQVAHESAEFRYVREIASGEAYEGRLDLGNTEPGDGQRFRGRALLQITGRRNYEAVSSALGTDFVESPELLEHYGHAARASCWWWKEHGCNEIADKGDFRALTKRINGGMNGWQDRLKYWERAKEVLYAN
jgi:putative chitinase